MPQNLFTIVLIAAMIVFMFFQSRKRKAQVAELATKVVPGAKVMLSSGIYGEIVSVETDRVVIKSQSSSLEVAKGAVARVVENAPEAKKPAAKKPAAKKPAAKK
jgi:preprotein translocase subunit YajC